MSLADQIQKVVRDAVSEAMKAPGAKTGAPHTPHVEAREERPMKPVSTIVVKGAVEFFFTRAATPKLTVVIKGVPGAIERIQTDIAEDKLVIDAREVVGGSVFSTGNGRNQFTTGDNSISIGSMSFSNGNAQIGHAEGGVFLNGKRVEGQGEVSRCEVHVSLPDLPSLKIKGSGNAELDGLDQGTLSIKVSGSSNVRVSGTVQKFDASISGSGNFDARRLTAKSGDLSVSGSGNIAAHFSSEVVAEVSGSGNIKIEGNPAKQA